ncbi:MAG: exodeoxyribonuclease VII large subunit [Oscillospiraceae bacterium]|jgi:exodeoxyribonuclease VII large subunit|nr:exodeoxyribonuclease VII large subunit [Oscillospiraceae bacterium]
MKPAILSVSSLNYYVKSLFEGNEYLQNVLVEGEISNFKNHYASGHFYFSLKDENSVIKCVMFSSFTKNLQFAPTDGVSVLIRGRVSIYAQTGQYQLYVEDMNPEGIGSLNFAFEQLKKKLQKEGLFDITKKKSIPNFPEKIGVLTSRSGSVLYDILQVLERRFVLPEIIFYPILVQGKNAAKLISSVLYKISKEDNLDVVIIARGGGSLEELWSFNEEVLARAIFNCKIPVISAIGHETDFTICDFVSDLRAPTPSAAAELVSKNQKEILSNLENFSFIFYNFIINLIENKKQQLKYLTSFNIYFLQSLQQRYLSLDSLYQEIKEVFSRKISKTKEKLTQIASKIDVLSPFKILKMGYTISRNQFNKVIKSIKDVNVGGDIFVKMIDGEVICNVSSKKELD